MRQQQQIDVRTKDIYPGAPFGQQAREEYLGIAGLDIEKLDAERTDAQLSLRAESCRWYRLVEQGADFIRDALVRVEGKRKIEVFAGEFHDFLTNQNGISYYEDARLRSVANKENYDCDTSTFLAYDIAKVLGLKDLAIVVTPNHALLKVGKWYVETTADYVLTQKNFDKRYPFGTAIMSEEASCLSLSHFNRGSTLSTLGRNKEALESYDKAIELNPEDSGAYNNRGQVLSALGRNREAFESYDKAIELNPYDNRPRINHSTLYLELLRSRW